MRYLSVLKFIANNIVAILFKLVGYVVTPLIFPHRYYINNYVFNFIISNKMKLNRMIIVGEDENRYITPKGYINKRKTNKVLGYILLVLWFFIDNDASLDCCSTAFVKPEDVKGLVIEGNWFDLGDKQRLNNISIWSNWHNFKSFYYWMVIRNGFYNYNYLVEDSYMDDCGILPYPPNERIHESNPNIQPFSEHRFYKDSNGKWFFIATKCWLDKDGFASGYEIGFRRLRDNKVNAVIRFYKDKKWINGIEVKKEK